MIDCFDAISFLMSYYHKVGRCEITNDDIKKIGHWKGNLIMDIM